MRSLTRARRAGSVPFPAKSLADRISAVYGHIALPVPPVACANRALWFIVSKMLAKEPDERFQTAEAVLRALQMAGSGAPPDAIAIVTGRGNGARLHVPRKLYGRVRECDIELGAFDEAQRGRPQLVRASSSRCPA